LGCKEDERTPALPGESQCPCDEKGSLASELVERATHSEGDSRECRITTAVGKERTMTTERDRSSQRVLVVEDDIDSAELMQEVLEASGYQVSIAHDDTSALEQAASFLPSVILLDLSLRAATSGYDVCRQLASTEQPRARVIAITGQARVDADQLKAMGFDGLLHKPIDIPLMLDALSPSFSA
jgi:CheY-like chemotaxis protein